MEKSVHSSKFCPKFLFVVPLMPKKVDKNIKTSDSSPLKGICKRRNTERDLKLKGRLDYYDIIIPIFP